MGGGGGAVLAEGRGGGHGGSQVIRRTHSLMLKSGTHAKIGTHGSSFCHDSQASCFAPPLDAVKSYTWSATHNQLQLGMCSDWTLSEVLA